MQGAHRHQPARLVRRSRSVQPHHRPSNDHAAPAQAAASQPRRSAGIMGLFERATSPVDTRDVAASPPGDTGADDDVGDFSQLPRSPPAIKYVAYKLNGDTPLLGQECPICFEDFEPGQRVARLSCLCTYHVWCINDWTMRTPSCPVHYN
ncbi:hypothetical protein GGI20_001410 [Coemansia sp. BCRC 34301]|nr:hypothetical protein GGI20_001410 [Coemansia sp. BCRC 34301]